MIVIDASALTDVLAPTAKGEALAGQLETSGTPHAPDLVDAETASAIRGLERAGEMSAEAATAAIDDLLGFRLVRHSRRPLLVRAWALRHNLTIYDGVYVALAEALGAPLLTTDAGLATAVREHTAVALADPA